MEDTNSLIEQRRQNLAGLNARGVNPFMNAFSPDAQCGTVRTELARWAEWNKSGEPKGSRWAWRRVPECVWPVASRPTGTWGKANFWTCAMSVAASSFGFSPRSWEKKRPRYSSSSTSLILLGLKALCSSPAWASRV